MFSLTYLLGATALAYPILEKRVWILPVGIVFIWLIINSFIVASLNLPVTVAIATVLPHGWLEFFAIGYWVHQMCKAVQHESLSKPINPPTFTDYLHVITNFEKLLVLVRRDIYESFKSFKCTMKTLSRALKRDYAVTIMLICAAALMETFITPQIMVFIANL
jgi:hypothetical protein